MDQDSEIKSLLSAVSTNEKNNGNKQPKCSTITDDSKNVNGEPTVRMVQSGNKTEYRVYTNLGKGRTLYVGSLIGKLKNR